MNVVIAQPPNLFEIDLVFPNRGRGIVYAYGDTIFNPDGVTIPKSILAHEAAHGRRQTGPAGIERWWRSYLDDPEFRYREEVIGHAAEYLAQVNGHYDRNKNARLLMSTAVRLLASFYQYGNRYSHKQAVHDLRQEAHRMSK